jgi:hypothetical protein
LLTAVESLPMIPLLFGTEPTNTPPAWSAADTFLIAAKGRVVCSNTLNAATMS